jgi:hypothetical protein
MSTPIAKATKRALYPAPLPPCSKDKAQAVIEMTFPHVLEMISEGKAQSAGYYAEKCAEWYFAGHGRN